MNKPAGGLGLGDLRLRAGLASVRVCGRMEWFLRLLRDRRFHRLAAMGFVMGVGFLLAAWKLGWDWAALVSAWQDAEGFLTAQPWWLFAASVVLPGFPVPTSALMILAGTVWRETPLAACGYVLAGLALNMCWTYWLAARPARGVVERLLGSWKFRLPEVPRNNHLRLILILRLTPGIPLFVQNYTLGFFRVPFGWYLGLSIFCNGLIACGVVLSSAGVAGGNFVPAITGIGLIVVAVLVVRMVRVGKWKR